MFFRYFELPTWHSSKESTCQAGDARELDTISGSGRSSSVENSTLSSFLAGRFEGAEGDRREDKEAWPAIVHGS